MARTRKPKSCQKCGQTDLWWKSFEGSWRLSNADGTLHDCPMRQRARQEHEPADPASEPSPEPNPLTGRKSVDAGQAIWSLVEDIATRVMDERLKDLPVNGNGFHETNVVVTLPDALEPVAVVENVHAQVPQIVKLLSRPGRHVLLVGPSQAGKTQAAHAVADALGLQFFPQSVGAQTSKTDLLGFVDAHGVYQPSILRKAYETGGLFLLDEMDAGNANVLTILNMMLANGHCSFPDGVVAAHPDFRVIACANTYGHGASRQYVGRNQLDAATLKRFLVVNWDYDLNIERQISASQPAWFDYIQKLRAAREATGVRVIISTRDVGVGTSLLNDGFSLAETANLCLFNSMSADDRAKLESAVR